MPDWLRDTLAASAPLLILAGVLIGHLMHRRSAREVDIRWRREETMRILRWAVDKLVDQDDTASRGGAVFLEALSDAELLQDVDTDFVDQVTHGIMNVRSAGYAEGDRFEPEGGAGRE